MSKSLTRTRMFFCIAVLMVGQFLLSFPDMDPQIQKWILWFGVFLPLGFLTAFFRSATLPKDPWDDHCLKGREKFNWILGLGLFMVAVVLRFSGLTTLSVWPMADEGMYSYWAIRGAREGEFRFFYIYSQLPPLLTWVQSLFMKVFTPSLFSLWLYPALLSILAVPAGWWAARRFLPERSAWIAGAVMALEFWPVYAGRFCHQGPMVLLAYCLLLGVLGEWRVATRQRAIWGWALATGFLLGGGFYIFFPWALGAAPVAWAVAWVGWRSRRERGLSSVAMALVALAVLAPILLSWWKGEVGQYAVLVLQPAPGEGPVWIRRFQMAWDHLQAILWNKGTGPYYAYKAAWGGLVDPLSGVLLLLGLVRSLKYIFLDRVKWIFLAVAMIFAPAFLVSCPEMFRFIQLIPFTVLWIVSGILTVSSFFPRRNALLVVGVLLGALFCINAYHLAVPYHRFWSSQQYSGQFSMKNFEHYQAYRILKRIADENGPGYVLTSMSQDAYDQSLLIATYPFNVTWNKRINPDSAGWVALPVPRDVAEDAARGLLGARTYVLRWGNPQNGEWLLWVPLNLANQARMRKWIEAERQMSRMIPPIMENRTGRQYRESRVMQEGIYAAFRGDRLLETLYWDRASFLAYSDLDIKAHLQAAQMIFERGYDTPYRRENLQLLKKWEKLIMQR